MLTLNNHTVLMIIYSSKIFFTSSEGKGGGERGEGIKEEKEG